MTTTMHPDAISEWIDAMTYYDRKGKGLGDELYDDIQATIRKIEETPNRWPRIRDDIRRCRADRFPYKVVYEVLDDRILIYAVMHDSRDPTYWAGRISSQRDSHER